MAKGASISVGADARPFQSGIKSGVIEPLEDVAGTLRDVAEGGDKTGAKLEDSMRDAQKDTEKLAGEYEDLNKKIYESAQASRRIGAETRQGTSEASKAIDEWGDEAKQNISETFSSFDGSAESFVDMIQGTFGGVISNLGPVGAIAGAAGAAGIGLIMKAFEDAKEAEQEFRERVAALAEVLIESGDDSAEAWAAAADRMREFVAPTEDGAISLARIRKLADDSGVSFEELAQAYAHAGGDLSAYIEEVEAAEQATRAQTKGVEALNRGEHERAASLGTVSDRLRELAKEQAAAEQAERDWVESGGAALQARAERMDALQGELDEAIGSWGDYVDAETGATDPGAYLAGMQARMDATKNFNANVQSMAERFGLSTDEVQAILDQGVDFAPMLQSIIDAGLGEEYAAQVRSMLDGGQAIVDGRPTTATVDVRTNAAEAAEEIDALTGDRTATLDVEADTRQAEAVIEAFEQKRRAVKVQAEIDLSAAEQALTRFLQRDRTVQVRATILDREGRPVP